MEQYVDKIICGDALEELKKLPDHLVSATVTDPPFGIGFKYHDGKEQCSNPEDYWKFLGPIYQEIVRVTKPGGFIAIWQANLYFKHFWNWFSDNIRIYCAAKNFVQLRKTPINYGYDPVVVQYKAGAEPLRPDKPPRSLDFFVANTAKWVAQTWSLAKKHPAPRPVDQVEELIKNFVEPEGLILDPFLGSGTTAVAAKRLGRYYFGIEKNPVYVELAKERIDKDE